MKKQVFGMIAALFAFIVLFPMGVRAADTAYAILYEDGELVFQNHNTPDGRAVKKTYEVDLTSPYDWDSDAGRSPMPWDWDGGRESVRVVNFADKITPASTSFWFEGFFILERIENIQNLDTSNVKNMSAMFNLCFSLETLDVSGFDTSNVTSMERMFSGCDSLTALDVSHFNTANVTDMHSMFSGCGGLTALDLSGFDTANVTHMDAMFEDCGGLKTLDMSGWDTAKVENMASMFANCSGLTALDVSGFNTADTKGFFCSSMFSGCSNLKTIYSSETFQMSAWYNDDDMFLDCAALVGGNGTEYDESHTDREYARIDTASAPGYFTDVSEKPAYAITHAAPNNGKLSVTLTNPDAVTVAVSCFDASGKFVSATLLDVSANAGTVALALPANAKTARVTLLNSAWRPLCEPRPAQIQ